eukprot:TRINITY_DN83449_c0_g1_i1.p1 TRINITY_DN83449_c0_g1~~TRINITY_DN83449_c0_g1_i1.p1  ORF type:complete len:445 (-),score=67.36 TRINITY_DN83449_c0_g1_i1:157-1491(-)
MSQDSGADVSDIKDAAEDSPQSSPRRVVFVKSSSKKSQPDADEKTERAEEVVRKWQSQSPGRIVLGVGVVLAGCAGFVNATASLVCGSLVSHVTGTTAKLGMALEGYTTNDEDAQKIYQFALLLVSFLSGATLCGTLVTRNEIHFGRSAYGLALVLNCALLLAAIGVFKADVVDGPIHWRSNWIAAYILSAACGLQNGMCTAHFGAVVRTTHLTGLVTDSGLTLGRLMNILIRARCNRRNFCPLDRAEIIVDLGKMVVFVSLFSGYVAGCYCGASMANLLSIDALLIPACITGTGGITYAIAKAHCREFFAHADVERDLCEAEEIFEPVRTVSNVSMLTRSMSCANLSDLEDDVGKTMELIQDVEAVLHEQLVKRNTICMKSTPPELKELLIEMENRGYGNGDSSSTKSTTSSSRKSTGNKYSQADTADTKCSEAETMGPTIHI